MIRELSKVLMLMGLTVVTVIMLLGLLSCSRPTAPRPSQEKMAGPCGLGTCKGSGLPKPTYKADTVVVR